MAKQMQQNQDLQGLQETLADQVRTLVQTLGNA